MGSGHGIGSDRSQVNAAAIEPAPELATTSSTLVVVQGSGCSYVNGQYAYDSEWDGKPMWKQEGGMRLWFVSSGNQWRIGRSNDYLYVADSSDDALPASGWLTAKRTCPNAEHVSHDSVDPAPTLKFM
jgi:hypothetical protein